MPKHPFTIFYSIWINPPLKVSWYTTLKMEKSALASHIPRMQFDRTPGICHQIETATHPTMKQ